MPIFPLRAVRRMLDELAPSLTPSRIRELESRLRSHNDQTVPTEWEIAIGYALSKVGKISDPGNDRAGNPDFIFVPDGSSEQIVVEVTALSDQSADRNNPVDEFSSGLRKAMAKYGISPAMGSVSWSLGDREEDGNILIGVPERSDIDALFKTSEFRAFVFAIKASPSITHKFSFRARDIDSEVSFDPGRRGDTGHYRSYKVARRIDEPAVFNRLKSKEKQLSKAGFELPAIVFLCDNDSHHLKDSRLYSPGTFNVDQIVSTFLNGREHQQYGPLILQKGIKKVGNRVHAVVTLGVNNSIRVFESSLRRELKGRLICASGCAGYLRSEEFLQAINSAIAYLPVPAASPNNAMHIGRWPAFFGGGTMAGNKVKISLLTLQKLMAGELSHDEFSEAHGMLATQIERLNSQGFMISSIEIEHQRDADDDWVTLHFDGIQPTKLFDARKIGDG